MIEGVQSLTTDGHRRAPTKEMLVCWVVDAWNAILSAMIEHSFKKCGISGNLDGTEDDIMFDDVCLTHVAPVGSNASTTETSSDDDDSIMWDDAAVPIPAAFFDSDDDSEYEGFH